MRREWQVSFWCIGRVQVSPKPAANRKISSNVKTWWRDDEEKIDCVSSSGLPTAKSQAGDKKRMACDLHVPGARESRRMCVHFGVKNVDIRRNVYHAWMDWCGRRTKRIKLSTNSTTQWVYEKGVCNNFLRVKFNGFSLFLLSIPSLYLILGFLYLSFIFKQYRWWLVQNLYLTREVLCQ